MTPYYEEAGITIYHGDVLSIPCLERADMLLTDPPYSRAGDIHTGTTNSAGRATAFSCARGR